MDVATYRKQRLDREASQTAFRIICSHCRQPDFSCFCKWLAPFDSKINFVILIHPIETQRRVATGRMAHLSLLNSRLIRGHNYSDNAEVNDILKDQTLHCALLFPGPSSVNMSSLGSAQLQYLVPTTKRLTLFVIDGTWATAQKTVHLSQNLKALPRFCYTPALPSKFRVRRQPRPECHSTIEAVHNTIELLGPACGFSVESRLHDQLLIPFYRMVDRQIDLAHSASSVRRSS